MLELIEAIYSAVEQPSRWPRVLRRISESIGATAYTIAHYAPGDASSQRIAYHGLEHDLLEEYDAKWAMKDPWRQRAIALAFKAESMRDFSVVHLGSLVPPAEMRKLPIFTHSFSRLNIYDGVLLPLSSGEAFIWSTFFCGAEKGEFVEYEIDVARTIAPHLRRAARLSEHRIPANVYFRNGKLSDFGAPAVILDSCGDVIDSNTSFKQTIGARAGGRFRLGDKTLSSAIQAFFDLRSDDRPIAGISVEADLEWRLRLHRLDTLKDILAGTTPIDRCLVLFERNESSAMAAASLKQRFELTEAESEIASLLLAGQSPHQIADFRECSISTVRWHLRQIYSKMGVTRRSELAERVSAA